MAEKKDYSLPYPKIKKEDKGWKAYFKIYNSKGIKSNTNGGWYEHKTDAENNALERQKESIKKLTEKKERIVGATIKDALLVYQKELFDEKNAITGQKHSLSYTEHENITTILNHYLFQYGSLYISKLEKDTFRDWLDRLMSVKKNGKLFSGKRINSLRVSLKKFIKFLKDNGYITTDEHDAFKEQLYKTEIPDREFGHVPIENPPTYADIYNLVNSFKKETFEDWYFYTFLLLGFFSSCRISELMALRWENIDFESCFIHIEDAITKREPKENVYKRVKNRQFKTKNKYSNRDIPMMNFYYFVIKDYMQQYKMKFNLEYDTKEFNTAFVFPAYQNLIYKDRENVVPIYKQYTNTKWINRKLLKLCEKTKNREDEFGKKLPEVEYFPCRYLRHAGCTHLAKYHEFLETEMVDYMGHSSKDDASMIRQIYQKIDTSDKGYRTRAKHPELYIVNPNYELKIKKDKFDAIADLVDTNLRENVIRENRANSLAENINYLYEKKAKREYYYTTDQKWIIEEWKQVYPERNDIDFIEEETRPIDEIDFSVSINVNKEYKKYKKQR